ncbi:MAG TPA: hypothetical protein VGO40_17085 [Longimicrobium sp.]|nr:hypothetical protein [Longimicrobium sp.]
MQIRTHLPVIATMMAALAAPAAAQGRCIIPSDHAVLIAVEPLEMLPGEARDLQVVMSRTPYAPRESLPAGCIVSRWSVPAGSHARFDYNGRLRLTRYARPGEEIVVTVDVSGRTVRQTVHVIDPHPNPIAGTWRQSGLAQCTGSAAAAEPVRELVIRRDGRFSATFSPFESYKDYWGVYTYDRASGALNMRAVGGNHVPPGLDLAGTARVANGRLTLRGMWLGHREAAAPRTCTYVFVR